MTPTLDPGRGVKELAFDRLRAMHATLTTDVASQYAERLASLLGDDLLRVSLFGSRARGDGGPRSDYDLMVVLRRASGENRDLVHGLATEIELEHGVDLSTKITDRERFERLRRSALPFWRHFVRDEEVLWPPTSSPNI